MNPGDLPTLEQLPKQRPLTRNALGPLHRWARVERAAWLDAVSGDPLLPNGYLGELRKSRS